jgi:hypothetical protein
MKRNLWLFWVSLQLLAPVANATVTFKYSGGSRVLEATCRELNTPEVPSHAGTLSQWRDAYQTIGNVLMSCQQVPGRERVCREDEFGGWSIRTESLRGSDPLICAEARRQFARCIRVQTRSLSDWCPGTLGPGSGLLEALCQPYASECVETPACPLSGLAWLSCRFSGEGIRRPGQSGESMSSGAGPRSSVRSREETSEEVPIQGTDETDSQPAGRAGQI